MGTERRLDWEERMITTHVELSEEQSKALDELAEREGTSVDTLVEQVVEQILKAADRAEKWERARALIGRFHSGLHDVSERHDDYLAEDFL